MLEYFSFHIYRRLLLTALVLALGGCKSTSPVVESVPEPVVSLTVASAQVAYNGQASLSWSASNVDSCNAGGGWSGQKAVTGNESAGPVTATTIFSLQCTGSGGTASDSVTVAVAAPVLSISSDRTSVNEGESVTLSWSASSAAGCTASGDWAGGKNVSGQESVGPLNSDSAFILTCTSPGGSVTDTVNVSVVGGEPPPPAPTLQFQADPLSVAYEGSSTLSWSSANADSCNASGDWSGQRSTTGSLAVGPLTQDSNYMLSCTGTGGTVTRSVTIQVATPAQPFVTLTASPGTVASGGSSTLSWSSQATTSCEASGAWSGARPVSGSEQLGPLLASSTFSLTCSGPGGLASESITVSVSGGGGLSLQGAVDSHWIDREGLNKVYIYAGDVQPDDYDGDAGDPLASATATQNPGSCTWAYALASGLSDGLYTVAFTADAQGDSPGQDDTLSFRGTATLNITGGSAVHDFIPDNIIRVGPTRAYTTFAQASLAASNGDVVEVDAGVYEDDISIWRQNDLTLRAVNGRAHLKAVAIIPYSNGNDQQNGMAIIVTRGDNMRLENLEFSGARVPDENGAGVRPQGGPLSICNSYFHDNENGILGAGSTILIEHSEFDNNGLGEFGRTHNIYIDGGQRFIFRNSYSHHANIGHNLKSRARENFVLYSRLMDEVTGTSSYAVDLPNGGLSYVIGNLLQQGPQGDNSVILNYGSEGLSSGAVHHLYVVNNSFVNDRGAGTFVYITGGTESAQLTNNLFVGSGTRVNGSAQQISNLQTSAPGFVDIDNYDYRLTSGSPAIDAGSAPGSGDGYSLVPVEHYVHKASTEPRIQSGPIDIGAYEYMP